MRIFSVIEQVAQQQNVSNKSIQQTTQNTIPQQPTQQVVTNQAQAPMQQKVVQQQNQQVAQKTTSGTPFTPEQEEAIKNIVKKMINDMLKKSVDLKL